MSRPRVTGKPSELEKKYMKKYRAPLATVRSIGVGQLEQMADHARATMFSTLRWEEKHRNWRSSGSIAKRVPGLYRKRMEEQAEFAKTRKKLRERAANQDFIRSITKQRAKPVQIVRAEERWHPDPAAERMMQLAALAKGA